MRICFIIDNHCPNENLSFYVRTNLMVAMSMGRYVQTFANHIQIFVVKRVQFIVVTPNTDTKFMHRVC